MSRIGSKIALKGVKLGNSAQKSATFDAFQTFLIKKGKSKFSSGSPASTTLWRQSFGSLSLPAQARDECGAKF